ncbi:MAG: acyl-CoA dehydrogenase family protein [Tabrizicola sp.]|uniref:acyl-CoA dehydrogenase family protein n=1 Tax=Tabrizicola sp. TaxID=2005166 RepID=UPI002736D090|nr:acyl-CoA dehydrogenase family protein [Tabrizicola sp.]MDP3262362.1 acyl-CoA dehydrogenase family protein [Tabrizicola sp.]MDP3647891.1 acyl-CoA dehydrogenase family protein [Paracoccaceae bacterium]MDZ4069903.1 acyl-CoA dehydrogenase family protein [Tabrizicola sp.]
MTLTAERPVGAILDAVAIAEGLSEQIAAGAAEADAEDRFVAENYALLKGAGLVAAGVPKELGGGGAEVRELAAMLRVLARACGSTALAFAMHTHQVAIPAWRWKHQKVAAVEPLLKRIAAERIILLSSGGSDWINGSGAARKVEGGYRISGRKIFTSGAAAGDVFMTGAVLEEDGQKFVLHFGASMKAPEVKILDTWHTLGMRGTGSHDVVLDDLFVPDAAVALKRKAGEWHPLFHIISTIAFPLIYAAYLGVADSACRIALELAKKRPVTHDTRALAGRMMTELRGAEAAHETMLAAVDRNAPSADTVNDVMMGKTLGADHAIRAVELAMELASGAGFYRAAGLERRFRDIQGARFHAMQRGPQSQYAGALALGESVATVF